VTTPNPPSAALSERYRIERDLGQGGMATVYLAEDVRHPPASLTLIGQMKMTNLVR
jgi:serine/threonine protein kinase